MSRAQERTRGEDTLGRIRGKEEETETRDTTVDGKTEETRGGEQGPQVFHRRPFRWRMCLCYFPAKPRSNC